MTAPKKVTRSCGRCGATMRVAAYPAKVAEDLAAVFDDWHSQCLGESSNARLAAEGDQPEPLFDLDDAPVQTDMADVLGIYRAVS